MVECGDGVAALERLGQEPADLVVTDLAMPGCDGLELVRQIKRSWPSLPVVLVTGVGSEQTAMEALRAGAASYTPKSALARDLSRTVDFVLDVAGHSRPVHPPAENPAAGSGAQTRSFSGHILDNDCRMIGPLIEHLQQQLPQWSESERLQIGMAVAEALSNAMYHGNLEVSSELRCEDDQRFFQMIRERRGERPFSFRKVHITSVLGADEIRIRVRDEGPGFDSSDVPDPTAPENLSRLSGRGLLLIRSFMDDVQLHGRGNEIEMVKRKAGAGGGTV